MNYSTRFLYLVAQLLVGAFVLSGQADLGSLSGTVNDASGAVVAGAKVNLTSKGTGAQRVTTTDSAGYYSFSSLPIGSYDIEFDQSGFDHGTASVIVDPGKNSRVDVQLTVGTTSTSVEVNAAAVVLNQENANIGTVVENQVIVSTPLFMRNWDDLIRLIPGVQQNRYTEQGGATASGRTGDFQVNGVHSLQNNFILDGVDNNTFSENVQELSTQGARPSIDAIQAFQVITNPYSAEYGRSPGAAVDVSTRGGSNQIHGLLFEYLRNRVFDANDFFSNRSGLPKPKDIQNQFGANLGGPILKNKLFFFLNYEGTRIARGITRTSTAPLPNERVGNFSPAAAAANGVTYPTIYDSTTNQPFPNNTIPTDRLSQNGVNLMSLFPLPNLPGELNNFARTGAFSDDADSYNGRIDWNASDKDNVFFRYAGSYRTRIVPGTFGGLADGSSTSAWGQSTLNSYASAVGWTHVFSASLLNDLRIGFVRNTALTTQLSFNLAPAGNYVPGVPFNPATGGGLPAITYANYTFLGSPDFLPKQQNPQQYQYVDTVSLVRGKHSFKFGIDAHAPMRNIFQDEADVHGNLQFTGVYSCQRGSNSQCVSGTGSSYADGLLGFAQGGVLTNVYFVDQRLWMVSTFAQDNWKVSPRLSLNLGLRYDFATPPYEGGNKLANFNPAGSGSLIFANGNSLGNRTLVQVNNHNFAPRVGLAYSIDQNTVLRGGYGIFYLLFERFGSEDELALNPPFLVQTTGAAPSTSTSPIIDLRTGYPASWLDPNQINLKLTHIRTVNPYAPSPYTQEWSFGIQRMLPSALVLEVNYVGTKSTHLDVLSDLNQPINGLAPYPNFGELEYQQSIGNGSYNALQLSLIRRFAHGLSLNFSYTFSKSIDDTPEELESNSGGSQNGRNQNAWRGVSDFNFPNRVVASYVYELPFGKGKPWVQSGVAAAVLGGWRTSGIFTYYSGRPVNITSGSNYSTAIDPYGLATAVPNVIGSPTYLNNVNCWFYASNNKACTLLDPSGTNAFAEQALGQFGNSGRNTLRGPSTTVFDFSVMRDFRITERVGLQGRWEVFNLANTPIFGQPNNNLSSGAVGSITSLASDSRAMQFALRLGF
ncbi:MAG: TonB-dependent receptor [Bryobacterales bacterium]|nr:TonB-dependent receptor [Bryobacterales bacterium]MBV9396822.1 TonB-dependent receptor [Bryobacterales bacterium]